jgi:hypothetical protein
MAEASFRKPPIAPCERPRRAAFHPVLKFSRCFRHAAHRNSKSMRPTSRLAGTPAANDFFRDLLKYNFALRFILAERREEKYGSRNGSTATRFSRIVARDLRG